MTAAFNNVRTGTFVNMINNRDRMVFQMLDNLRADMILGTGKRTGSRLEAWIEAFNYCAARSNRSIWMVQLERRIGETTAAA